MSNLKEIRSRIASVKSTLKITSAMRLIASAKLHSAQGAVENMVPYEKALGRILSQVVASSKDMKVIERYLYGAHGSPDCQVCGGSGQCTAVLLVTSNQTLCGGFNSSLMRAFEGQNFPVESTKVYAIGKYGLKNARKMGYECLDFCSMSAHADFDSSSALADSLVSDFLDGKFDSVKMIYSHFASTSSQPVQVRQFLPLCIDGLCSGNGMPEDFIMEPAPEDILRDLLPQELRLMIHTVLLDAATAEHAARTLAMQIASDNATDLIGELSLQYNKLRQQAITNEILDLLGGQTGR